MADHNEHLTGDHGEHHAHGPGARAGHGPAAHVAPAGWRDAYVRAFAAAQPQPGRIIVDAELEARDFDWEFTPGLTTRAWGFNGAVPGPTIEARVGDVLQVRLTNRLREPTAVHWHGLRVPAAMDGTEMVQRPVAPGETFTYRFSLPDAGTFWYHPHVNETVQLERGLYGAIVVRGPDEPRLDAERVLVLDDVRLDRKGAIKPPGGWIDWHNGREGNTRLVNGRREPELTMAAGQVERWRIVNAASARYVRLSIGGHPFRILGTDGGLLPAPVVANEIVLAPADRVDLAVGPFAEGERVRVESLRFVRGKMAFRLPRREVFATVRVGPAAPSRADIPDVLRRIEPIVTGPVEPTREVRLGWKTSLAHGVDFTVGGESHHRAEPCRVGELQVWDVVNGTPMHHPFHLHGFFFQVLEVNGRPPAFLSWEDTVDVPARGRVRIAWVPDDRPGSWMFHCHILEHHAAGMMAHFEVVR
ncbi:MAG TPA: multicopper oxidase family protein [Anaeromyxobacter sp.]|nr:multicopper oxidase family protein [Anaeromyxobacter sp.]